MLVIGKGFNKILLSVFAGGLKCGGCGCPTHRFEVGDILRIGPWFVAPGTILESR